MFTTTENTSPAAMLSSTESSSSDNENAPELSSTSTGELNERRRRQNHRKSVSTRKSNWSTSFSWLNLYSCCSLLLYCCLLGSSSFFSIPGADAAASGLNTIIQKVLTIKTCGKPNIQNIMMNVTAQPGQMATFKCQVDMSCIVAFIEWYHVMENGTEQLIKTASSSGDPHVHIIREVQAEDEGLYTCIAGNVLGHSTTSAYLQVNLATGVRPCSFSLMISLILVLFFSNFGFSGKNNSAFFPSMSSSSLRIASSKSQ